VNFVAYVPTGGRAGWSLQRANPFVKLSNRYITLNKAAREMLGVDNGTGLELAFDPDEQVIRITPGGIVRLSQAKVFAWDFFSHFGIRAKGVYPAEIEDGVLYVKIG